MRNREITNREDIIDSRDIIERINNLQMVFEPDEDETQELIELTALSDEAINSPDWKYGTTLIRDSYFETYVRERAENIGAINDVHGLQQYYKPVDFAGVTYWLQA